MDELEKQAREQLQVWADARPEPPEVISMDDLMVDWAVFFATQVRQKAIEEHWVSVEERLPADDSEVLAAIWWINSDNPDYSHYLVHDCLYYEGGSGSGQKIFADCEGQEFEHDEVQFWMYKKDLCALLAAPPVKEKQ